MEMAKGIRSRFVRVAALAAAISTLMAIAAAGVAGAGTIGVYTTIDQFGAGGLCSLREAIQAANNDVAFGGCSGASGADVIQLPAGVYKLTIPPAGGNLNDSGDLDNFQALRIESKGTGRVVIDANGIDRAFENDGLGANLTLANVTVRGGASPDNGGGILNSLGTLKLKSVTLTGNTATVDGGGLSNYSVATLTNATISGNRANGSGGGVYGPGSSATSLKNSTIAGNTADADGSGNGDGGGFSTSDTFSTYNTVIGDNADTSPNPANQVPDCDSGPDFFPRFTLIEAFNGATCLVGFNPGTNITGQDPKLGPLADNGGPVPTRALLAGSPALGAGGDTGLDTCAESDARGLPRVLGGACDLGAYELVKCRGVTATRVGTDARDVLKGTARRDVFALFGGNDKATGLGGNDLVCGGEGKDKLIGGKGKDQLLGEQGADILLGGAGKDKLIGGPGKDKLTGGAGKDVEKQ